MENAEKKPSKFAYYGFVIFITIGWRLLSSVLKYFSFNPFASFPVSMLIIVLIGYPLFIQGTVNRWTKRQWTFPLWVGVSVILILLIWLGMLLLMPSSLLK